LHPPSVAGNDYPEHNDDSSLDNAEVWNFHNYTQCMSYISHEAASLTTTED
jgi:hypothetical protein